MRLGPFRATASRMTSASNFLRSSFGSTPRTSLTFETLSVFISVLAAEVGTMVLPRVSPRRGALTAMLCGSSVSAHSPTSIASFSWAMEMFKDVAVLRRLLGVSPPFMWRSFSIPRFFSAAVRSPRRMFSLRLVRTARRSSISSATLHGMTFIPISLHASYLRRPATISY